MWDIQVLTENSCCYSEVLELRLWLVCRIFAGFSYKLDFWMTDFWVKRLVSIVVSNPTCQATDWGLMFWGSHPVKTWVMSRVYLASRTVTAGCWQQAPCDPERRSGQRKWMDALWTMSLCSHLALLQNNPKQWYMCMLTEWLVSCGSWVCVLRSQFAED